MTLIETCDIDAGGIRLSARTAGTGPLVLLVHGFPGSAWSWRHQMAPLAEAGWQTVAIDTRGYGGSERPADGPWTTEAIEQDLLGVIDSLGAQQAVVVGQDFGAKYAWNLARHHPDRVRAVAGTVPFADLPQDAPPSAAWATLGEEHFLHLHYFQAPGVAERDLGGEHVEEFLRRLLWALSAGGNYFSVFGAAGSSSYLDALAPAPALPWSWLTEADFATYAEGSGAVEQAVSSRVDSAPTVLPMRTGPSSRGGSGCGSTSRRCSSSGSWTRCASSPRSTGHSSRT